MASDTTNEVVAQRCWVEGRRVCVELADGRQFSFPSARYPRLAKASAAELAEARLRVGGRALRWEALDEDIWLADAFAGRFPRITELVAA